MAENATGFSASKLTPFAREFSQRLFHVHPEWLDRARLFNPGSWPDDQPYDGYDLLVEVPSPHRCDSKGLIVQTDSALGYIIIGLGPGSAELADWYGRGQHTLFDEALELINDIIAGRYVGIRLTSGGCGLMECKHSINESDIAEAIRWNASETG